MSTSPLPASREEPSFQPAPLALRLALKGQAVQSFRFEQRVVSVGRDPNCDVYVDNPGVSRHHFQIECAETGEYRVVDGGSANGTYLNERPIRTATLRSGDQVQFAKYTMEVQIEELIGGGDQGPRLRDRGDGATVMLSPSEVRQIVSDSRGPAARPRPVAVPRAPELRPAPPRPLNAWLPWAVIGLAVAIAFSAILVYVMTH